jgi:hypothetical protein
MMAPAKISQSGAQSKPWLETAAGVLAAASVGLALCVSSLMLSRFGISYEEAGGPAWHKIHPATPVAVAAFLALALSRGNPIALFDEILARQPGAMAFALMILLLTAYVVWRVGGPVTQFIDTFVLPLILFVVLIRQDETWLRKLSLFVHGFMAFNAILGLAEFALGFRLTPLIAEGVEITTDWRSTALLGHPLLNAAATACYAFMLLIGGGRDLPVPLRIAAFLLQTLAMVAFGGRAATGLLALFSLPAIAIAVWRLRGAYRMTLAAAGVSVLFLVSGVLIAGALAAGGFFDRFAGRFLDDGGSAAARTSMFEVIDALSPEMLWFGSDPEYIASLQRQVGIPFGIESFWIAMIANQGLLFSIPFFLLFFVFLNEYRRWSIPGSIWSILLFLLIISTSTSLSSKTAMLTVYTIAHCALLRPYAGWRR